MPSVNWNLTSCRNTEGWEGCRL